MCWDCFSLQLAGKKPPLYIECSISTRTPPQDLTGDSTLEPPKQDPSQEITQLPQPDPTGDSTHEPLQQEDPAQDGIFLL